MLTDQIFAEQEARNDRFLRAGVTTVTGHARGPELVQRVVDTH